MQITENTVVALDYKLTDDEGALIDQSQDGTPLFYLHGVGQIIPGLESRLEGKSAGDRLQVTLPPEEGYGQRDPELIRSIPLDMFEEPEKLEAGLQFDLEDETGVYLFTIQEVREGEVVADGNHELAGMNLTFDVTIREVREASAEEVEHGHAHGPDMEPH